MRQNVGGSRISQKACNQACPWATPMTARQLCRSHPHSQPHPHSHHRTHPQLPLNPTLPLTCAGIADRAVSKGDAPTPYATPHAAPPDSASLHMRMQVASVAARDCSAHHRSDLTRAHTTDGAVTILHRRYGWSRTL